MGQVTLGTSGFLAWFHLSEAELSRARNRSGTHDQGWVGSGSLLFQVSVWTETFQHSPKRNQLLL